MKKSISAAVILTGYTDGWRVAGYSGVDRSDKTEIIKNAQMQTTQITVVGRPHVSDGFRLAGVPPAGDQFMEKSNRAQPDLAKSVQTPPVRRTLAACG